MSKPKSEQPEVAREVGRFVSAIDSLAMTVEMSMEALSKTHEGAHKKCDSYVEKYAETTERDGEQYIRIRSHEYCHDYNILRRELDRIHAAQHVVPQSFLVALVSRYDALLGGLVRALFRLHPEALKSSERALTFAQLTEFSSIDAAREFVLEKEVDALLRKSHPEQFDWLEKKFEIHLRTDLPAWPHFVEITERRNLFVHADGVISSQYIENCKAEKVQLDEKATLGRVLNVNATYFKKAHRTVFEIGVKLAQVLWRKVAPKEAESADRNLTDLTYELLVEGKYDLAKVILDFADTTLAKRHANERYRLMFLVNRALAHYLSGQKDKCAEILATQDWSATDEAFRLAESVLFEKFSVAAKLMKKIGVSGYPHKADYLHWPLFSEFRKTPLFVESFKEVFGDATHEEQLPPKEPPSDGKPN
jgi:hypothetical protein